jgi:predicted RNA binding protein YcfA (HicA-like mRNA interferase family)
MGRLGNISGKDAVKAFGKASWQVMGQVGSHVVMTKSGVRANLSSQSTESFQQAPYER